MAPLQEYPVEIAIDSAFTLDQRSKIESAVGEWNRWAQSTTGRALFKTSVSNPSTSINENAGADQCAVTGGDSTKFSIVRETDKTRWSSLQLTSNIPAATIRCSSGASLVRQIMLINTSITDPRQLKSVALHELGHTIGLDHSCLDGDGKSNYLSCSGLPDDHDYHVAVLYPILRVSRVSAIAPEIKELIRKNDDRRAACLLNTSPEGRP